MARKKKEEKEDSDVNSAPKSSDTTEDEMYLLWAAEDATINAEYSEETWVHHIRLDAGDIKLEVHTCQFMVIEDFMARVGFFAETLIRRANIENGEDENGEHEKAYC